MNKVQMTTTGGIAVGATSIKGFWALFGDYKIAQLSEAFKDIPIAAFGMAITGLILSIWFCFYNEDKNNGNK